MLPEKVARRLEWDTLERKSESFIDDDLENSHAHLLFTVRCQGRQALLYVLFEHQSSNDPRMAYRLLQYCVRIWDEFAADNPEAKKIPAILPVVLYHGERNWTASPELSALLDLDPDTLESFGDLIPRFRFILEDPSAIDDEALRTRSLTAMARASLLLLSRARETPDLVEDLRRWVDVFSQIATAPHGLEALAVLLEYALQVGETAPENLRDFARQLGTTAEEAYMTAAEVLKAEGEARGKALGKAEMLLSQLGSQFGSLSETDRQRVLSASSEELDVWAQRVLTASSKSDVFD